MTSNMTSHMDLGQGAGELGWVLQAGPRRGGRSLRQGGRSGHREKSLRKRDERVVLAVTPLGPSLRDQRRARRPAASGSILNTGEGDV